jgi:tol-pal system protein YbgF
MKNTIRNIIFLLAICPFLVQCASQDEVNRLNYQLRVMNKKLNDMKTETVEDMQKRQAASADQIDQLQNEIMTLRGQLEETANLNKTLSEKNREEREAGLKQTQEQDKAKEARIEELSKRLELLQSTKVKEAERKATEAARHAEEAKAKASDPKKITPKPENESNRIMADKKKSVKEQTPETATVSKTPPPPPPSSSSQQKPPAKAAEAPAPASSPSNDAYNQAKAEYEKGNFQGAFKHFEGYIGKNETGEKSIEARYMMGECLFKQKEYDQSILQYQKIVSNYPQHPKAAAALLRQGMAFESLSDKDTAKIIYKKIISAYGNSPEAATAKQRSGSL